MKKDLAFHALWRRTGCTAVYPALAAGERDFSPGGQRRAGLLYRRPAQLRENRSFLPMAATFQALGYEDGAITWDNDARTVTAERTE